MKRLGIWLLIAVFFQSCLNSKKRNVGNEPSETSTKFNSKLADSLGADSYGMKNYSLVILKTGPKDSIITDQKQRAELFKGHFANMEAMQKTGKLVVAGPFGNNHLNYRGIFILNEKDQDIVKALLQQDPTIKNGIFEYEILPWYGSAALPMYLQFHEEIAKENP